MCRYPLRSRRGGGSGYSLRSLKAPVIPVKTRKSSSGGYVEPVKSKPQKKPKEDPEDAILRDSKSLHFQSSKAAKEAISYLSNTGLDYELVKLGGIASASTGIGIIQHANFRATLKHVADAPVEMMFAQARYTTLGPNGWKDLVVDGCISLGPADKLPNCLSDDVYLGSCQYCTCFVHHPRRGMKRLLTGCDNDDDSWLG